MSNMRRLFLNIKTRKGNRGTEGPDINVDTRNGNRADKGRLRENQQKQ